MQIQNDKQKNADSGQTKRSKFRPNKTARHPIFETLQRTSTGIEEIEWQNKHKLHNMKYGNR